MSRPERPAPVARLLVRLIGVGIVGLAFWLALGENVDTDATTGPTNCGVNAVRVLLDGPSVNRSVLSADDCREAAAINLGICAVLVVVGIGLAVAAPSVVRVWWGSDRRQVFTSVPQVLLNTVAAGLLAALVIGGLSQVSDALVLGSFPFGVLLLARTLRLGVVIDDGAVTVRNVLRTRTIPLADVEAFEFVPTPWWLGRIDEWAAVRLVDGRHVPVSALVLSRFASLQGAMRRRVDAMNAALHERKQATGSDVRPR